MTHNLIDEYIAHGWSLVPIPPGSKGPRHAGWNLKSSAVKSRADLGNYGVGLAHAYTGTMALDIDNWDLTRAYGLDVDGFYAAEDAVIIHSGRAGHGKLLYRMPFGLVLPTKKISVNKALAFELRCGTLEGLTVQDVLPPSIHPETQQPYQWAGRGHWTRLPVIPDAVLEVWMRILKEEVNAVKVDGVDASWEDVQEALRFISADCTRDEWITVGMALHWAGTKTFRLDEALAVWNEWSWQSATKYPGAQAIQQQWNSFRVDKGTTVTLGSLFHLARQGGWVRPTPDAATLFGTVEHVPSPESIIQGIRPVPPDMDLSLWPETLRVRAEEVSESVGCDPLVPLFSGLAAACGVIDAQTRLELMHGFKVPPVLWLMTLGDPADKKSPGSRPMFAPIKAIEDEDRPRYSRELTDWEAREAGWSAAKKAFLDFAASPEALLGGACPEVGDKPAPPVALKITVSDITSQKLVRHAAERPRGLLCHLDEMASWVRKMVEKSSGEDRSSWVVSYESERYEMDRVGGGSIHAENLAVSIYGNIQPKVFKEHLIPLANDGLLQRFIPGILRQNKTRLGNPIPAFLTHEDQWENTLRLIFALPPMTYKLSDEAFQVYRRFQEWYEGRKGDERLALSGDIYMTAFGKLEGLVGRLALMWHVIETPFAPTVSADVLRRVIKVVRGYIIPAYRYAFGEVGGASQFETWLTDYIIHHANETSVTMAEIRKSARRPLEGFVPWQQTQMILNGMIVLEQAKWVGRMDDGSKEHIGRAEWLINPALKGMFKAYRTQVIRAKQNLLDKIHDTSLGQPPEAIRRKVKGAEVLEDQDDYE